MTMNRTCHNLGQEHSLKFLPCLESKRKTDDAVRSRQEELAEAVTYQALWPYGSHLGFMVHIF